MPQNQNNAGSKLIICDTNIVILMVIFKPSVMFAATYSFGTVEVDYSVIEELQRWIDNNNAKAIRLGTTLIQTAIEKCEQQSGRLTEPTAEETQKSNRFLSNKETQLSNVNRGADSSKNDKRLLTLAWKNKAHLATQDRTMRAIAQSSLPSGCQLLAFHEMVVDLFNKGLLTAEDISTGLLSLEHFKESLSHEAKQILNKLLLPPSTPN